MPGSARFFYLFHLGARYDPVRKLVSGPLYYSVIDLEENGGDGAVIQKNTVLAPDMPESCCAVRHGNGRDWLIVARVAAAERPAPLPAIRVYPNPAAEGWTFEKTPGLAGREDARLELAILNTMGAVVYRGAMPEGNNPYSVAVRDWPAGVYFWQISRAGRPVAGGKLVKG